MERHNCYGTLEPAKVMVEKKAKNIIVDLFRKHQELDYGEIMEKSGLDLDIIVQICEELEKEGKIKTILSKLEENRMKEVTLKKYEVGDMVKHKLNSPDGGPAMQIIQILLENTLPYRCRYFSSLQRRFFEDWFTAEEFE